jgi:large subunit ribosomal protein L6
MSRIGKLPIKVPSGVTVTLKGRHVSVKGPKGLLEVEIPEPIEVAQEGDEVKVTRPDDSKVAKSRHGLSRTLIQNLVTGVTDGYEKQLEVVGVGYKAAAQGKKIVLNVGLSHPIEYEVPEGITVKVEKSDIIVSGIDKQKVGHVAATIRKFKKPSVYSGKGIKYKGEVPRRKVGKAAASG